MLKTEILHLCVLIAKHEQEPLNFKLKVIDRFHWSSQAKLIQGKQQNNKQSYNYDNITHCTIYFLFTNVVSKTLSDTFSSRLLRWHVFLSDAHPFK